METLTLRDQFAIAALQGELASQSDDCEWVNEKNLASRAYEVADAMLAERSKHSDSNKQGLISGADALRALANGEEVEFKHYAHGWVTCLGLNIEQVIHGLFQLRLKPRTVKLEIEVPAPFEPKVGEEYYYLNSGRESGYAMKLHDGKQMDFMAIQYGAWRTEADIKIVVEQLRKIKEHSK